MNLREQIIYIMDNTLASTDVFDGADRIIEAFETSLSSDAAVTAAEETYFSVVDNDGTGMADALLASLNKVLEKST